MLLLLSFLPLTLLYQVFNNYGAKANEELIMGYGFALHENVHDVFGLSLAFSTRAAAPAARAAVAEPVVTRLGPFYLRREDPRWEQFPPELWAALASFSAEAEEREDGHEGGGAAAAADDDDEEEQEAATGHVVGAEEVELLLATLRAKLAPFGSAGAYGSLLRFPCK